MSDDNESLLDKIKRGIAIVERVSVITTKAAEKAAVLKTAIEQSGAWKDAGLCRLCGSPPSPGFEFCRTCLGKLTEVGLKHTDAASVKDFFFGKKAK